MLIKDWLDKFLFAHQLRHVRTDWPAAGSSDGRRLWSVWFDAFKAARVTHREAEMASREINAAGLEWIDDHLPTLLGVIEQGRARPETARAAKGSGSPGSESKDQRYAEAARAIAEVGTMTPEQRLEFAAKLLDQFADLGWAMEWREDEQRLWSIPVQPDAPQPGAWLSCRLRALRAEVYATLGHPLPGDEPLPDLSRFSADGKFDWRRMVEALGERVHATSVR